jgi:hypothetical protein
MPLDMNTKTTRAMYLLANDRLIFLSRNSDGKGAEAIADAICQMGPGDHMSDYKTDEELIGAIRFMNWIIDHVQYARGETKDGQELPDPKEEYEQNAKTWKVVRHYPIAAFEGIETFKALDDEDLLDDLQDIADRKRVGGRFKPIGKLRLDKSTDQIDVYFKRKGKDILFCTLMSA